VKIVEITRITDHIVLAFQRLIPQLNAFNPLPTKEELTKITKTSNTILFAAMNQDSENEIVGTLTLVFFRTPTELHARIEDVVVDTKSRGKGIGRALIEKALKRAAQVGAKRVDLTSNPSRKPANRLYRHLGFKRQKTNLYHYRFEP
jgi:ribosomal protein S18 acetylase RimI-like enzyme